MTIQPRSLIRRANSRVHSYSGWPRSMRAEPKMLTLRRPLYGAKTRNE